MLLILLLIVSTCKALIEDAKLNFTGLASKYGYPAQEYDVTTQDGYILKLFRIKGPRKPVLLIHGAMDSADGFIIRGNRSLAINLAREGYDVWAINHRGNTYSRRHTNLSPSNLAFWDFDLHNLGSIDLPDTIDFIEHMTESKISLVGYSQGTTAAIIMGATKPEYNEKVNVFIALAPICYIFNTNSYLEAAANLGPYIDYGLEMSGTEEFAAHDSVVKNFLDGFCRARALQYVNSYDLCLEVVFLFVGVDRKEFEPDFLPVWLGHYPAGTSRRVMNHFAQIANSKAFGQYNYGTKKNLKLYGSEVPPEYDVRKVTMKTAIFVGENDKLSTIKDVRLFRKMLPNIVEYRLMKPKTFNHLDFVWGRTVTHKVVSPQVVDVLEKYG